MLLSGAPVPAQPHAGLLAMQWLRFQRSLPVAVVSCILGKGTEERERGLQMCRMGEPEDDVYYRA